MLCRVGRSSALCLVSVLCGVVLLFSCEKPPETQEGPTSTSHRREARQLRKELLKAGADQSLEEAWGRAERDFAAAIKARKAGDQKKAERRYRASVKAFKSIRGSLKKLRRLDAELKELVIAVEKERQRADKVGAVELARDVYDDAMEATISGHLARKGGDRKSLARAGDSFRDALDLFKESTESAEEDNSRRRTEAAEDKAVAQYLSLLHI